MNTPQLVLEPLRENRYDEACALVERGIHDPDWMPFEVPFTDAPSPRRELDAVGFWLSCWAGVSQHGWRLPFAVLCGGALVGVQDIAASGWVESRTVATGSWLGREHQGRGLGREMRAAVLHLALGHLGAERAESCAFEDNTASRRVSEVLGYREAGLRTADRRGEPAVQVTFAIDRDDWPASAAAAIEVGVHGVDDRVLAQLGATLPNSGVDTD
ncbi:MAG: GNAT family N-acetyltransferase [Actinomycetia bacterium]|nr:GNAT family N-acetyltransferase [Actinomycetes bacterium]